MTFPWEGEGVDQALERDRTTAEAQSSVDYLLHPVVINPDTETQETLPKLAKQGFSTIKLFLTDTNFNLRMEEFVRIIEIARDHEMVVLMHCEDGALLSAISTQLQSLGKRGISEYAASRPDFVEEVAIQRAISLCEATGAAIYAVHTSSAVAIDAARVAKKRSLPFTVETRPMYLHLTQEALAADDGAKFIGAPPLRERGDLEALWAALNDGTVDTIGSDHAPWSLEAKLDPTLTFKSARQGVADLDTSLPLLWTEGVHRERISINRFVDLVAARPAQLFGLWPRKGLIAPGSDADIAIWDPQYHSTVQASQLQTRADYSVYEGWQIIGAPITVLSRGEVVMSDRRVIANPGRGRWLPVYRSSSHSSQTRLS
jgi:dihydropyrimidinase